MLSGKVSALPQVLGEGRAEPGTLAKDRWGWVNSLGRAELRVRRPLLVSDSGMSLKPQDVSSSIRQNNENVVAVNCPAPAAGVNQSG